MTTLSEKDILFIDNHLLVINKSAGIVTQGALQGETTLAQMAKDYLKKEFNKPGNVYLGIVSRLDSRVSGVIVFARTSKSAARLNEQFKNRTVTKSYWAIVSGNTSAHPESARTVEHLIYKDNPAHRMRCIEKDALHTPHDAKPASLSWETVGTHGDQSLLEVSLHTGRKHQIRCQLAAIGLPILGDRKYGSQRDFAGQGIALHSKRLEITHPTLKTPIRFDAEVPISWKVDRFIV